jgi:uncharacterized protein (DUF427 family)
VAEPTERVWDYPRPPRVERSERRVRIVLGGLTIVDTTDAVRVLETSHPPGWYVPAEAFDGVDLVDTGRRSFCEFKGRASYLDLVGAGRAAREAAWTYPDPSPGFEALAGMVAVYPGRVDRCLVDDEEVRPQEGGFYGGWITDELVGPFKGGPGSVGW